MEQAREAGTDVDAAVMAAAAPPRATATVDVGARPTAGTSVPSGAK